MNVAVVTINHNNCEGLQKTIDSVISQINSSIEYIVIDGGSKDGSVDIIKNVEGKLTYWMSEPDRGIYHAMNKGFEHVTSDYVLFLNSGDTLHNDQVMEKFVDSQPEEVILYGDVIYDFNGKHEKRTFPDHLKLSFLGSEALCHQTVFFKSSEIRKYPLFNEKLKIVSDWEHYLRLLFIHKCSQRHLQFPVTIYDTIGISNRGDNLELRKKERQDVLINLFDSVIVELIHDLNEITQTLSKYKMGSICLPGIFGRLLDKLQSKL